MDRQARNGDTVLVKSREMTGREDPNIAAAARRKRSKDDRKQNIFPPVFYAV
jgi:hypothetical protein